MNKEIVYKKICDPLTNLRQEFRQLFRWSKAELIEQDKRFVNILCIKRFSLFTVTTWASSHKYCKKWTQIQRQCKGNRAFLMWGVNNFGYIPHIFEYRPFLLEPTMNSTGRQTGQKRLQTVTRLPVTHTNQNLISSWDKKYVYYEYYFVVSTFILPAKRHNKSKCSR